MGPCDAHFLKFVAGCSPCILHSAALCLIPYVWESPDGARYLEHEESEGGSDSSSSSGQSAEPLSRRLPGRHGSSDGSDVSYHSSSSSEGGHQRTGREPSRSSSSSSSSHSDSERGSDGGPRPGRPAHIRTVRSILRASKRLGSAVLCSSSLGKVSRCKMQLGTQRSGAFIHAVGFMHAHTSGPAALNAMQCVLLRYCKQR